MNDGKIVLMKGGQPPLMKQGGTVSQDSERILGMNENVTTDDRVEPAARLPPMNIRLDAIDIFHSFSGRASLEGLQCGRIDVH